jgi:phosphomevalonate kinase
MHTSSSAPGSSASKTDQPSSSRSKPSSSSSSAHLTAEERLMKEWRTMASSMVGCFQKAEKAAKETTKENCKELDESVVMFLKMRMVWHRLMSHVQAKVQGKEQEMQALENYVRTQPRLGKRKREEETVIDAAAELPITTTTPPPTTTTTTTTGDDVPPAPATNP